MSSHHPAGHVLQVRAAALSNYVSVAASFHLDGPAMLRDAGIDPRRLDNPEARISAVAVSALLEESARRSGCDTFALRLVETRSFSSLGPLSLLLRHEANLRAVLERLIVYRGLISRILEFELADKGDETWILVDVVPEVATRQTIDLVMGLTCRFLSGAMFGGWQPAKACFRYPAPADLEVHHRLFRAPLHFGAPLYGFIVPTESLDRANAYGDAGFVAHALDYVELLTRELPGRSLADEVRSAIKRLLPAGRATLVKVAEQLNMHPRALQRKLAEADLRFAELVEETRERLARDLLADTNLPLTEIAQLVGYASSASFSRWFAASAGQPPRSWRLQHRTHRP